MKNTERFCECLNGELHPRINVNLSTFNHWQAGMHGVCPVDEEAVLCWVLYEKPLVGEKRFQADWAECGRLLRKLNEMLYA